MKLFEKEANMTDYKYFVDQLESGFLNYLFNNAASLTLDSTVFVPFHSVVKSILTNLQVQTDDEKRQFLLMYSPFLNDLISSQNKYEVIIRYRKIPFLCFMGVAERHLQELFYESCSVGDSVSLDFLVANYNNQIREIWMREFNTFINNFMLSLKKKSRMEETLLKVCEKNYTNILEIFLTKIGIFLYNHRELILKCLESKSYDCFFLLMFRYGCGVSREIVFASLSSDSLPLTQSVLDNYSKLSEDYPLILEKACECANVYFVEILLSRNFNILQTHGERFFTAALKKRRFDVCRMIVKYYRPLSNLSVEIALIPTNYQHEKEWLLTVCNSDIIEMNIVDKTQRYIDLCVESKYTDAEHIYLCCPEIRNRIDHIFDYFITADDVRNFRYVSENLLSRMIFEQQSNQSVFNSKHFQQAIERRAFNILFHMLTSMTSLNERITLSSENNKAVMTNNLPQEVLLCIQRNCDLTCVDQEYRYSGLENDLLISFLNNNSAENVPLLLDMYEILSREFKKNPYMRDMIQRRMGLQLYANLTQRYPFANDDYSLEMIQHFEMILVQKNILFKEKFQAYLTIPDLSEKEVVSLSREIWSLQYHIRHFRESISKKVSFSLQQGIVDSVLSQVITSSTQPFLPMQSPLFTQSPLQQSNSVESKTPQSGDSSNTPFFTRLTPSEEVTESNEKEQILKELKRYAQNNHTNLS